MNDTYDSTTRQASRSNSRLPRFFALVGYSVCVVIVSLILLEVIARVGVVIFHHFHKATVADIVPGNPAYAPFSWADDCIKDQAARVKVRHKYFPFRIWGLSESHGACVNDDVTELGVIRRTINAANPACGDHPKLKVWVFGGSTVYGTLIPDWATLPSALSKALSTSSRCVEITNLGVESYNTNQELILLQELLKAGHVPDLVIFYDGFNDINAAFSPGGSTGHLGFVTTKRRLEGGLANQVDFVAQHSIAWQLVLELTKAFGHKDSSIFLDPTPQRVAATLDNYEQNLKIAHALGKLYGFKVCAFWQPVMLYGHKPLVPYEQQLLHYDWGAGLPSNGFVPVYQEAERRSQQDGSFLFLGYIFDSNPNPLYLDWVHLNPDGNAIAARAIAGHMEGCLSAR